MPAEVKSRRGQRLDDSSILVITALDGSTTQAARRRSNNHNEEKESAGVAPVDGRTSHHVPYQIDGLSTFRESLRERGISEKGTDRILASWKPGTSKQYRSHINRWAQFCHRRDINPTTPIVTDVINFLTETFHRGVGYNSINTARGALSSLGIVVDGCRAGNHPLVIRLMRGVFNLRPSMPRYKDTWDVKPVLTKLKQLEPLQSLPLKELTLKLVMLMALTQAARVQTLHLLVLKNISIKEEAISVWLGDNIKQCRPGFNIQSVKFFPYTKDESLCVCRTLRTYLEKTEHLRDETGKKDGRLLISFIKPHKPVSRDTIARWIKHVLTISGIDSTKYTASSVRSAAASQARSMSVPIRHIMSKAGWSRESTFAKHYNKEIVQEGDPFQDAVLD
ncbi:uncharacterized protein LOC143030933 [Oratosquilla oratoria]|uniref:uncharacterized protein LOC143030933 n=1 Tax=Oratosquilla oratoria TaxID=337810 RepID=UPI003F76C43D